MGASNSSELDNQRIAEIATEANGQFAKEFQFAFKDAVINKIKTAYLQPTVKLSLLQADTPSQTIKTGHLLKLGANIKNWKRRKFVAKNKSDNYAIIYYEDDHELKEKGRFNCCGYEVDVFSAEECGWYGQFGIKLKSHDDARRMWLFRAESEEDQRQWIEVLTNACKKAKPDIPRDAVFVEAFTTAYRVTRAAYGYFGVFSIIGTECEMLEYLTNEILSREMLDQFIVERGARSNSVARKNLMISVHHSVQKIIRPIAASTWRSCFSAADFMRASFELSVKASLRLLLDKEAEIRAALRDKMEALVEPYTSDLQIKTCMPVLQCAFGPLLEAYEAALLGLHRELRKALGGLEMYPETAAREMLRLEELIEQVGGGGGSGEEGPLAASQRLLWRMHTVDLTPEVQREVLEQSGGVSGYDLYAAAMDDLKALLQNAVHTFGKLSQPQQTAGRATITSASAPRPHAASVGQSDEATVPPAPTSSPPPVPTTPPPPVPSTPPPPVPTSPPPLALSAGAVRRPLAEVLDEVVTRLTADAKVSLQRVLTTFLLRAVESKVQENMVAPSYEVSLGAHKLVTRETQLMINLSSLGEGMVRDMVRGHIVALMGDLAAEASSRLNMVAVQLIGDTRSSSA